ncbi:aromatic prenyltransferase, partial [Polyplosphaeria fusca]
WYQDLAPILDRMVLDSGYTDAASHAHLSFLRTCVCGNLADHPSEGPSAWKSYMNDDSTPIELSWSWSASSKLPKVRYVIEPLGKSSGSATDPFNVHAPDEFVANTFKSNGAACFTWYHHFSNTLTTATREDQASETHFRGSSKFIGMELDAQGHHAVKAYIMPRGDGITGFRNIANGITSLPDADSKLISALRGLEAFLTTLENKARPRAEMLAIDCTTPEHARLKIYIRTQETNFDSVVKMMTRSNSPNGLSSTEISQLRDFWRTILGLDESVSDSDALPAKTHPTSGIIYHYELRLGSSNVKTKLYIPVKHYGGEDFGVAQRFSQWLERNGKGLHDSTYLDSIREMCGHRDLAEGLGFQTYMSAMTTGDGLAVSSYIQPELYHWRRQ